MNFASSPLYGRIAETGAQISLPIFEEMAQGFAPLLLGPPDGVEVTRDLAYGSDPRHRLNLFRASGKFATPRPVLVFVHGGGFVSGGKEEVPDCFYDNVGYWCARNGFIGIVINYRLAPDHTWPAGAQDVAAACTWVREHIADWGGNPGRIFLAGHSAGAAHVAAAASIGQTAQTLAGCICISGLYDLTAGPVNTAYFGADRSLYAERSPIQGLIGSKVPLLAVTAQFDPDFIQQQFVRLLQAMLSDHRPLPPLARLARHNHFSVTLHLNTADDALGEILRAFVQSV